MSQLGENSPRTPVNAATSTFDFRPWKLYVCPFCVFIERNAKNGLDHLETVERILYLRHLKTDHGISP
jgi:hypothetical protein